MSASNGGPPAWLNGLLNDDTTTKQFFLDLHSAKQDNGNVAKKANPNAQALGSLGGKARARNLSEAEVTKIASKGGKARAAKLSAVERRQIAKLAVAARERRRKRGR